MFQKTQTRFLLLPYKICRLSLVLISLSFAPLNQVKPIRNILFVMAEEKKTEPTSGIAHLLARKNILELSPYRCARDDYSTGILLDANENAFGPTSLPTNSLDPYDNHNTLERYPCPYQVPLKELYASYRGNKLTPANIFVGVGSDEAIDLLMRIFCQPGKDKILTTPPTYGMYKVCAKVNDVEVVTVPLEKDFSLRVPEVRNLVDKIVMAKHFFLFPFSILTNLSRCIVFLLVQILNHTRQFYNSCSNYSLNLEFHHNVINFDGEQMLAAVTPDVKLLFICSPGNPTAKAIPLSVIEEVAKSPQYKGLVVVDEAYVDFSTEGTATSLVQQYPNVVVLQTLSKAFGLAGIRCGFCIGAPDVIQLMNNVKAPYNVNALTSEVAINALKNTPVLDKHVSQVLAQRKEVMRKLCQLDFVTEVFASDANFVLFRMKGFAMETYKNMADSGVVTRYRGTEIHCENCIRVTIGTEEENEKFFDLLVKTYESLSK